MKSERLFHGTILQGDTPDWTAAEELLGADLLPLTMWMYEIELEDGARVHAYKDRITRRYLHLAEDGRAFVYTATGRYLEIDHSTAIAGVFLESPNWLPTEAEETAVRVALEKVETDTKQL